MTSVATAERLADQLELADLLRAGRDTMLEPQDLPGRYGQVIRALDHLLNTIKSEAVVAGGWAVWRHGYLGRVTQDVDIVVPAGRARDDSDVVELVLANPDRVGAVRRHLGTVHAQYVEQFDELVARAREQTDR